MPPQVCAARGQWLKIKVRKKLKLALEAFWRHYLKTLFVLHLWQTRILRPKKAIRKDKKQKQKKKRRIRTVQEDAFCLKRANSISVFFVITHPTHTHTQTRGNILSKVVIVERKRRQLNCGQRKLSQRRKEKRLDRERKLFFFIIVCMSKKQLDHISTFARVNLLFVSSFHWPQQTCN